MAKDLTTIGNDMNEKALKVTSITGTWWDKHALGLSELLEVTHLPDRKFNLFSTMKMQMNGWQIHGDTKAIQLTKGEHEVAFDIIILTNKGLFLLCIFWCKTEIAGAMTDGSSKQRMAVNEAHEKSSWDMWMKLQDSKAATKEQGVEIT
jgi:hypothetical protein